MIRFGENIVLIRVYIHTEFEYSMMYTKGDIQKKPLRINLGSAKFWNSVLWNNNHNGYALWDHREWSVFHLVLMDF